jgi:hypothetical protein
VPRSRGGRTQVAAGGFDLGIRYVVSLWVVAAGSRLAQLAWGNSRECRLGGRVESTCLENQGQRRKNPKEDWAGLGSLWLVADGSLAWMASTPH